VKRPIKLLRSGGAMCILATAICFALGGISNPAGADTTLGGFTLTSVAEGATFQYEQPNLPVPATPSVELDEGYSATSDNYGPTGTALASTLYPGAVLSNVGPQLALLVPGVPLPPVPAWPIEALSLYPQTPNTASSDEPGVTMESNASDDGNTATASIGNADPNTTGTGGASNPGLPPITLPLLGGGSSSTDVLGATSSILGIQALSSSSSSIATGGTAVAKGTAIVTGLSLLGGLIYLGTVTSTATATSDGNNATLTGSTTVTGASIDGVDITIDSDGIHAIGSGSGAIPLSSLNGLLNTLGITLSVTKATDVVNGAIGSRQLDGLRLDINLTDLDKEAPLLTKLIPASILSELPVPIPNEQIFTVDLASVVVKSGASPAFDDSDSGSGSSGLVGGSFPSGATGFTTPTSSGFSTSPIGTLPSSTTSTPSSTPGGTTTTGLIPIAPAAFKGVGTGLVLLGLLGAALLMLASIWGNAATEGAAAAACDPDDAGGSAAGGGRSVDDE
jgi:hypothetical protein